MIKVSDQCNLKELDEAHMPIKGRTLNEWDIPGFGHFEVGNFGQKMTLQSIFSPLGAIEQILRGILMTAKTKC